MKSACFFLIIISFLVSNNYSIAQGTVYTNGQVKEQKISSPGVKLAILNDGSVREFDNLSELIPLKKQVIAIQIQFQNLTIIPEELKMFPSLELIDLSHNQIEEMQATFFKHFSKLKKLYINDNPVSKDDIASIEKKLTRIEVFHSKTQLN